MIVAHVILMSTTILYMPLLLQFVKKNIVFYFSISLFISLIILPTAVGAEPNTQTPLNAGFVNSLWYSSTKFTPGQTIRIYSTIQNQSGYDLVGKLQLYDNNSLKAEKDFSIVNGTMLQQWFDLTITTGTHKLYKKISEIKKSEIQKTLETITIQNSTSQIDEKISEPTEPPTKTLTSSTVSSFIHLTTSSINLLEKNTVASSTNVATTTDNNNQTTAPDYADKTDYSPVVATAKKLVDISTAGIIKKLENTKDQLAEQLKNSSSSKPLPLLEKPIEELEKKTPFFKFPREKLPTLNHVYSWLITTLLYLLHTWWVVILFYLVIIIGLWRLWRRLRRNDDF